MAHQISNSNEDELIHLLTKNIKTAPEILTGIGDDCAVIKKNNSHHTLLKTDTVVESIHFNTDEAPHRVGWKAAARVISDFAAMGGQPEALMITIILPPDTHTTWVTELYKGIITASKTFKCSIVGGETSSTTIGSPKIISISGSGTVKHNNLTLRSTANPTDLIYVTGTLGGSINGKHLDFQPRITEAQWLTSNIKPTSMMDLSDGIAKDLPRLAKKSNCGFRINKNVIPTNQNCTIQQALTDGEDYELLFSIPANKKHLLETSWPQQFNNLKLTQIGQFTAKQQDTLKGGWDHFTQQ